MMRQVGTYLLKSLSGSAAAPFKGAGYAPSADSPAGAAAPSPLLGGEHRGQSPSPAIPPGMSQGPARAEPDFLCDQDEMLNIRPEDFKRMVRAGAMATAARDAHNVREATPQTGPQGLPPNGREEVDEPTAAVHDFQQPHALIVGNGEEPGVLLLKAEDDTDLIHNVYLQCVTAVPFNNVKVHVFNPADGSSLFLPRTGADDEGAAALARALGRDTD